MIAGYYWFLAWYPEPFSITGGCWDDGRRSLVQTRAISSEQLRSIQCLTVESTKLFLDTNLETFRHNFEFFPPTLLNFFGTNFEFFRHYF